MRSYKFFFFLLFIAIAFLSCRKQEEVFIISGNIVDTKQGIDLEGAKVELFAQKVESGIYSAHYDNYGTQITDSNGEFSFEIPNQTYAGVKLVFSKEFYFGWEYEINGDVLKNDLIHNETYQMQARAWIEFFIKNESPEDSQDYFEFRIMNGLNDCEECCTGELLKFYGADVEQDILCQVTGHEDISIRWNSRKGNVNKGDVWLVFIPSFDTTRIQLTY